MAGHGENQILVRGFVCQAKEFRFYTLSNGEPLKVLEQGVAFLEKGLSGPGLCGRRGLTEPKGEAATANGPCERQVGV